MEKLSFTLENHLYEYPCFELYQQFEPDVQVVFNEALEKRIDVLLNVHRMMLTAVEKNKTVLQKEYFFNEKPLDKHLFKGFLYLFLSELFNVTLDWGILTGIKPVKMAHNLLKNGFKKRDTMQILETRFKATHDKIKLITNIAEREMSFIYPLKEKNVSIYIGIPLCIAKCSYCSFISTVADKKKEIVEEYLENLLYDIRETSRFFQAEGINVDTVYIGGGTPSILNVVQLERLLISLQVSFDLSHLREYTFEAGRPETTDIFKLQCLKKYGIDRICLNPQTMNAETLKAVGRNYSPEDIVKTNDLIRKVGFKSTNMDLILGLNNESEKAFMNSLERVVEMAPENITVHSLSVKKGSAIKVTNGRKVATLYSKVFYDRIIDCLAESGYIPYYLYRQKYTLGNGENIGYCKKGVEGIYNILMMAEKQSIIGIGAGSSGKLYRPEIDRFDRIFTVKDIKTYNERTEEIIQKKIHQYEQFFYKKV